MSANAARRPLATATITGMDEVTRRFVEDQRIEALLPRLPVVQMANARPELVPDERLRAIGLVVVRFQRIEFFMKMELAVAAEPGVNPGLSQTMARHMKFSRIVDDFQALAVERGLYETEEERLVVEESLQAVRDVRNKFLHSVWGSRVRVQHERGPAFEHFEDGELELVAAKFDAVDRLIDGLLSRAHMKAVGIWERHRPA